MATALEHFGGLDVVVNNAGFVRDRMFVSATVEEWDATMKVHLRGHFCVARHAVDYWRACAKQGKSVDARIINTSSGAGLNGSIAQSAYAAAKGGIASLTLVQAAELQRYGITANALAPAARTRMTEQAFAEKMKRPESGFDVQDPDNIAPAVVWLGSTRVARRHRLRVRTGGRQDHDRRGLERRTAGRQAGTLGARARSAPAVARLLAQRRAAEEGLRHMSAPAGIPPYPPGRALLAGKAVLVTAAAGTGIGFATAKRALEEGARVFVSDMHERRLAEAVERLRAIDPQRVEGKLCDVTRETDVRALVAAAIDHHGRRRRAGEQRRPRRLRRGHRDDRRAMAAGCSMSPSPACFA